MREETRSERWFIAIEWPRGCRYWRFDFVIDFLEELDLTRVMFDGCMIGLRSILNGKPIKKPWCMATNCEDLGESFHDLLCNRSHEHTPCAGGDTKATESYSYDMVRLIHKAFNKACNNVHKPKIMHAMPCRVIVKNEPTHFPDVSLPKGEREGHKTLSAVGKLGFVATHAMAASSSASAGNYETPGLIQVKE